MIVGITILWCIYASLEGFREARHFYYRVNSSKQDSYNEHSIFFIQRLIVWIPFAYLLYDPKNILTIFNGVFIGLTFVLWHDGIYYFKRNKLDGSYPKGFWDQSNSSTSSLDNLGLTGPVFRITYFVAGLIGLIIINYAKY